MVSVTHNVPEIDADDRRAIEHLIGRPLAENQQVLIRVINQKSLASAVLPDDQLPDWCRVYEGLSDAEIAELEKVILTRADLTRIEKSSED